MESDEIISWFSRDCLNFFTGLRSDQEKRWPDAIIVPHKPGLEYVYNFVLKKWEKTVESCKTAWLHLRNTMLSTTAWLEAGDSPLDSQDKAKLLLWRASLQVLFDQPPETIEEPSFPDYVKKWEF